MSTPPERYPQTHSPARSGLSSKNWVRHLFNSAHGRGVFYRSLRGRNAGPLGSAIAADGSLATDPTVYMDLTRQSVAKPFSTRKDAPAVLASPDLTDDERATGVPRWWRRQYARPHSKVDATAWEGLMSDCTAEDLQAILFQAPFHRSPGRDGVPLDLLKIGARPPAVLPIDAASPFVRALACLVNACLRTGVCPPSLKKGIIVLVPKPGKVADRPEHMRPITLLPEMGKLITRLLAARLTRALHKHPTALHSAQRAYLVDGSSRQCLSTLLDVIEDYREKRGKSTSIHIPELVVTSYDLTSQSRPRVNASTSLRGARHS